MPLPRSTGEKSPLLTRMRRVRLGIGAIALAAASLFTLAATLAAEASTPGLPPTSQQTSPQTSAPRSGDPLNPFFSDSGLISLSVDAIGTNDPAGAALKVHKNAAGAKVRKAFLFAASTGFSGYTPVNGDVTLDGSPVNWNSANTISNDISSVNVESDVTSLVKAKVNAAPAGNVSFTAAEPNDPSSIDGEILAVILDDPTVTKSGSVSLLYGAQNPAGDTFHVALAEPVDKSNPDFALNLGLGISYGYQPVGQFSTVDVNGTQMTSSAGGQDDCVEKYAATPSFASCDNGTLITAGGVGDSNDNPPDPNADDTTCVGADGPAPRCDDELYSLLPFVKNGDTDLTFTTTNPSNDDNIFFAALDTRASAAVVGKGVVLSPTSATNKVGQPHTLTATVQNDNGNPIRGATVHFQVTSGPNAGTNGNAVTDSNGKAKFTYTSSTAGTDHIVASFTDSEGKHTSNEVTKKWIGSGPPPTGVPGWEGWHTNFGAHCSARVQVPFLTGGQQVAAYTEVFCNRPSDVTVRSRLRADLPSGDVTVAQNGCATGKPSCVRHLPLGYTYFYLACPKSPTQQHNHSYYTDIVLFPGTRSGATGPFPQRSRPKTLSPFCAS